MNPRRPFAAAVLLAVASAALPGPGHAAAAPDDAVTFAGRFEVIYIPRHCRQAPCPPGWYRVMTPGGAFKVRRLVVDTATPTPLRRRLEAPDAFAGEGLRIEGGFRLEGAIPQGPVAGTDEGTYRPAVPEADGTLTIRAQRVRSVD